MTEEKEGSVAPQQDFGEELADEVGVCVAPFAPYGKSSIGGVFIFRDDSVYALRPSCRRRRVRFMSCLSTRRDLYGGVILGPPRMIITALYWGDRFPDIIHNLLDERIWRIRLLPRAGHIDITIRK